MNKRKPMIGAILIVLILLLISTIALGKWAGSDFGAANIGEFDASSKGGYVLIFALLAGAASFFAPCALALFPGYISYYLNVEERKDREYSHKKILKPVYLGIVAALGILSFYLILGVALSVLGASLYPYLPLATPIVGAVFIILGSTLLFGLPIRFEFADRFGQRLISKQMEKKRHTSNTFLFGVGYGATAIGCTFPVFAAIVIYPFISGDVSLGILAFISYALAKAILMIATTILVVLSKDVVINKMMLSSRYIKKFSGIVMVAVGIYLIYFYSTVGRALN